MTNYEWLLNMGGEERQAWFDAQHVDANDALTRKGDVRADDVCANDVDVSQDSREKLEADASELTADYAASGDVCDALYGGIVELLDRQAAITECEVLAHPDERDEQIAELTAKLESEKKHREYAYKEANKFIEVNGKLAKNVRLLTTRVDELTAEREHYRELLSEAIRYAHEIVNLQP